MFTGIIEAIGTVASLGRHQGDWRLGINVGKLDMSDVSLGDSIAVNGCCLTVVQMDAGHFLADVSNETMEYTTFGKLSPGSAVNLEKAMRANDRFGGHFVSGHVDGVGEIYEQTPDGQSIRLKIMLPENIARYVAAKGSICMDGISLTVNEVDACSCGVNVIPHTQDHTIIGSYVKGQLVNLEVDVIARYLERLMSDNSGAQANSNEGFRNLLTRAGFFG